MLAANWHSMASLCPVAWGRLEMGCYNLGGAVHKLPAIAVLVSEVRSGSTEVGFKKIKEKQHSVKASLDVRISVVGKRGLKLIAKIPHSASCDARLSMTAVRVHPARLYSAVVIITSSLWSTRGSAERMVDCIGSRSVREIRV
jgi:hypothetical protein